MINFGERLRKIRKEKDLTQLQLAQQLGLTKSVISAYETGLRMPSYETLIKLSSTFNISTDFLLGVETKKTKNEIDWSGLSEQEVFAIKNLILVMKQRTKINS